MMRLPGLRPLHYRDFALYWTGLTVSQIGDWMETTTTAWLLYEITRSPLLLGVGGGIRALVTVAFGLIGGAVADRFPRRRLLFVTQGGFALSSLALGALVVTGEVTFWHIYAFSAVNGTLAAFDAPARRSLFPTLVPRSELQNAITLSGSVFRLGRLIGPAVAGAFIASYGPAVSYFVNVASYAAIILALAFMRAGDVVPRVRAAFLREVAEGVRYTLGHGLLRSVLLLESVHGLFGINTALITILASDVLHVGPEGLGILLSAQAVGGLGATAALVTLGEIDRKGRAMVGAGVGYAAVLAMLASATRFELAVPLLAAAGFSDGFWATMRNTMFQYQTEEAYRGRTMSVLLLAGRGSQQGSQLETGLAISFGGPAFAVLLGAAVIGVSLTLANALSAEIRAFRGAPEPLAAVVAATAESAK
jgi:MFS family permease